MSVIHYLPIYNGKYYDTILLYDMVDVIDMHTKVFS